MSSKRVRYFKKEVKITSTSFNSGTNLITVTTTAVHNLATGDVVSILMKNSTTQIDVPVTVLTTTTLTFPSNTDYGIQSDGIIVVPFFRSLDSTAVSPSLTLSNSTAMAPLLVSVLSGSTSTATAAYKIQGSIDNTNWFDIGTAITQAAGGAAMPTPITVNAPYLRINITTAVTLATEKLIIGVSS